MLPVLKESASHHHGAFQVLGMPGRNRCKTTCTPARKHALNTKTPVRRRRSRQINLNLRCAGSCLSRSSFSKWTKAWSRTLKRLCVEEGNSNPPPTSRTRTKETNTGERSWREAAHSDLRAPTLRKPHCNATSTCSSWTEPCPK